MSNKPTDGERIAEIQQRALRELVPTHRDATFDDIIVGQRKAMEQTAAEFAAPYLARIAELEMALDSEGLRMQFTEILIDALKVRIVELGARPDAAEALQRVRRCAMDFARQHGIDECKVVDLDTIVNAIDAELVSLTEATRAPDDVCDSCMGLGSHVQTGMACPHCAGSGAA